MEGVVLPWFITEQLCPLRVASHIAIFSNNMLTVHWVEKCLSKSCIAGQLIYLLALCLILNCVFPLMLLHVNKTDNALMDIPLWSFGSEPKWHCKSDTEMLTLFNCTFPLLHQSSLTVFFLMTDICLRVFAII
ncbi:hypothetical protein ACHAW6_012980 [Cyclotella cf. meneghiniana]